jgi:RNA 2',3'-cyclic 3'-phosphodiesterase
VRDPAAMLRRAHGIVEDRLEEVGLERESRAYTAHLTLARFRDSRGAARQIRTTLDAMAAPDARWTADRVTLYQSRLSPKGSVYTALLHAPLRQNA